MTPLKYYRTIDNGEPFLEEILKIKPWVFAEQILTNAHIAIDMLSDIGLFENRIAIDRYIVTEKRKFCAVTEVAIYETFYDNSIISKIPYVVFSWNGENAIILDIDFRDKNNAIGKLSNYPHLSKALDRLSFEFDKPIDEFQWALAVG